jgi:acyl-CoA synthetase (AMP-forming)/AMP-acid ligase II
VNDVVSDKPVSHGVLLELLERASDVPALLAPGEPEALSYGGLTDVVDGLAERLAALGVERGDRVALALPPGPEFVELLLAVAALGAAAAPLNPVYGTAEFAFYLDDLRPRVLLVPAGELDAARQAAEGNAQLVDVTLVAGGPAELEAQGATAAATRSAPSPDDVALLLHTSGTTSRPKQVPLRHRNLMASARAIARHYALTSDDVSYCAMPLFHVHGLVASTLAQLAAGGTVLAPRRVAPARFWSQLAEHGATWYSASPTLHRMVLERAPERRPDGVRLRFVRSCSSALAPELATRIEAYLDAPMLEAYGMTEASHEMAANPLPPLRRVFGSVGIPTGAEIRIVGKQGRDMADGSPGEVVIRGAGVMDGYLGNAEANADAFVDGWFRTGDQGRFDEGYLVLTGRLKEIIIRGGENISPLEVEDVLLRHPAVSEAVAYGVPDAKYGQLVGVAVVPAGPLSETDVVAHCREHLAPFKVPSVVHVVETIPRTPTGKVQRPRMPAHFGED